MEWESIAVVSGKRILPHAEYERVTGAGEQSSHTSHLVGQCVIYQRTQPQTWEFSVAS